MPRKERRLILRAGLSVSNSESSQLLYAICAVSTWKSISHGLSSFGESKTSFVNFLDYGHKIIIEETIY